MLNFEAYKTELRILSMKGSKGEESRDIYLTGRWKAR